MRHRIVTGTGLGNPEKEKLSNQGKLNSKLIRIARLAFVTYFPDGFDHELHDDGSVTFGIEPAYQYERLKMVHIDKKKARSYISQGKAWGPYGSQIAATTRYYKDYKFKSKFVKFIDQAHAEIFGGSK